MSVKRVIVFVFAVFLFSSVLSAQPSIQWQRCLGGSSGDGAYSIQQTSDGGFIVAGETSSNDGDVSGYHGGGWSDFWVVKLNSSGEIEWQRCLGGSEWDRAWSIQQTSDGGFIVAGYTESNDGDVSGNHGGGDAWVVKLNSSGEIEWQKCLGGSGPDGAYSIQQTSDGGFVVAGYTYSSDGDVSGNHGGGDAWVVKLGSTGTSQWQRCLGGSEEDWACSIQQTSDGGFIVAGYSESNDGDVSGYHGGCDAWVVKLNSSGEIEWQRCLGGSEWDRAYSIQQTSDGGFIVAGYTESDDGDVSGWHEGCDDYGYPLSDCWVVKLNSRGEIEWQRCLGGSEEDWACSIQQTSDGGFIVAGGTWSNDGDVSGNHGGCDAWVVKLNSSSEIEWQRCLGGSNWDGANSIQQTSDGGFIGTGCTYSNDDDVSGNHGGGDAWVVKLSPFEGIAEAAAKPYAPTIKVSPNPFNSACEISVPAGAEVLIYDIEGNLVHRTAARGGKIIWVPGKTVGSGVYTVRVRLADGKIANRKVVYLK